MIYCDTSYLVRLYLDDVGCEAVRDLCLEHLVASAEHARVELPAALHRAHREKGFSAPAFAAQMAQFDKDDASRAFFWYPLTSDFLAGLSGYFAGLPPTAYLRAADALHLACAAKHGFTEVWSNDKHFLAATPFFGLKGRNVVRI